MFRWNTLAILLASVFSSHTNLSKQVEAGHPYQDRYSSLGSNSLRSGISSVYPSTGPLASVGELSGSCNGVGGNCPLPTYAKLQLWVPDEATVYINGQRTKPQSLGGVHKNSRIYMLEGLGDGVARDCEIVVDSCDATGRIVRMQKQLLVHTGERLDIRYPAGFIAIAMPEPIPTMEEYESSPLSQYGGMGNSPPISAPLNSAPRGSEVPGAAPGAALQPTTSDPAEDITAAILSNQSAVPPPPK